MKPVAHSIQFESSDVALNQSFQWAKAQALAYVSEDGAAGDVYEASLPGRDSFCMRDYSHQCIGAHFLGLTSHNRNMAHLFAKNISQSRDWCSYWEITFQGEPTPVDYRDDTHFWYNLPANFDIVKACGRLYDLTGDEGYLTDPEMVNFHRLSVTKYVERWDRDGDGLVDRRDADDSRGIASYDESNPKGYRIAGDALALQAGAYREAARMMRMLGEDENAKVMLQKAEKIKAVYQQQWWNEAEQHYYTQQYADGSKSNYFTVILAGMPVIQGLIDDPGRLQKHLDFIIRHEGELNIEDRSYVAAMLWRNGRPEDGRRVMLEISGKDCPRREYPEISYSVIDALVTGYMGLDAQAEGRRLITESRVPEGQWAKITDAPLWGGAVDLYHEGKNKSVLVNHTGESLVWQACGKSAVVPDGGTVEITLATDSSCLYF